MEVIVNSTLDYNISMTMSPDSDIQVKSHELFNEIRRISYMMVMPVILGFGIIGNILNIVILCRKKLQCGMDKIERCAAMGFIFLAVSDLCFCLVGFPSVFFKPRTFARSDRHFEVAECLYSLYRPGLMNVFLFSSTWCVVFIAIERYLVVTHPIIAQSKVRLHRTVIFQVLIPVISVIINIPYFTQWKILHSQVDNKTEILNPAATKMAGTYFFSFVYRILWNTLIAFIPMVILFYCNLNLIYAIYKTKSRGYLNVDKYSTSKITSILILIVTLYFILVCPSVILNFIQEDFMKGYISKDDNYAFLIAVVIANVVQSANFAINFLLYFGMHPNFRQHLACNRCPQDGPGYHEERIHLRVKI